MSNVIRIDFDQMDDIVQAQDKCANGVVETARDFDKSFKKHEQSGVLVNSIKVEKQGLATITSAISTMNNVIRKHTESMKNYDESVARKAEEIEIPRDYLNENATRINSYNYSILSKIDGRAVTEGLKTEMVNEIDESSIEREDKLKDITKEDTKEQVYDDSSNVVRSSALKDITSGADQQEQKLDENTAIGKSVLSSINNGSNQQTQDYNDSTVIGKSMLGNIATSTPTQAQSIDVSNIVASQMIEQDEKEKRKKEQEALNKEAENYNFEVPNESDK